MTTSHQRRCLHARVCVHLLAPQPPRTTAAAIVFKHIANDADEERSFPFPMSCGPSQSNARLIQSALAQGVDACVLLLHSNPHLRQALLTDLIRSPHQLEPDDILRIFSLTVFGYEPPEAVDFLKELKPAGYCGHVFKEGEISYKCAHTPFQRLITLK
jgi:hypothetical protein